MAHSIAVRGFRDGMEEPFGLWLIKKRAEKRLTQKDVASRGGLSQGYVSDLEVSVDSQRPLIPSAKMQLRLATGLGVPLEEVQTAVTRAVGLSASAAVHNFAVATVPDRELVAAGSHGSSVPVGSSMPAQSGFPLPIPNTPPPRDFVRIPVLGRVAAGVPLFASTNVEEIIWVDRNYVGFGEELITFALRVRGCSMAGAGILPGDELIVRQAETAEDGDLVVALIDDEATVKRLRYHEDKPYLEAEPSQGDKHAFSVGGPWRVIGIVKLVQRKLS